MSELIVILLVALPLALLFMAVGRRVRQRQEWTQVDYIDWIYAVRHGLTADAIVGRMHANAVWPVFYLVFVAAAAIHAPLGIRTVVDEWLGLRGRAVDAALGCFALLFCITTLVMRFVSPRPSRTRLQDPHVQLVRTGWFSPLVLGLVPIVAGLVFLGAWWRGA